MKPAPFYLSQDAAQHHTLFILDKAGDPLAMEGARDGLVETVEAITQGIELSGLRCLRWG